MPVTEPESAECSPSVAATVPTRLLGWLFVLLLGLATLLAYQPIWHAGFIWDDDSHVTGNLTLRSLGGLVRIWTVPTATPQYYPLVHTSFWFEYHLWGLNPLGYHLDNLLLHILATVLLWKALVRLEVPAAWLAAAIFALHPVNVESVAWITERKNVLSTVLYFSAALAYWRWLPPDAPEPRPMGYNRHYWTAFGLFVAALLSKTTACSLPAALLLVTWWKRGRIERHDVRPLLPFFAVGMALGLLTSWLERTHVGAHGPEWALSFGDRCLIAGRAVWFYAAKLFWPAKLTFIYPYWKLDTAQLWQWLFPVAALALVGLLWGLRQCIGRGPMVAVLFFGGTLLPALGFTNLYPMRYSFVADHFQYVAEVGLIVLVVTILAKIPKPLLPVAAVLPLGLGFLTWQQAHFYETKEAVWKDTLAKNPGCWMAYDNMGLDLLAQGQTGEAIHMILAADHVKPNYAEIQDNLGVAYYKAGRIDDAVSQYQLTMRLDPERADPHNNLGIILVSKGRVDDAIAEYQQAIRLKPDYAEAHLNLGAALMSKHRLDEAITEFQEAIRLKPDDSGAYNNLGAALIRVGRMDKAVAQFHKAIELEPTFAEALANLGNCNFMRGEFDEAIRNYREAARLQPNNPQFHFDLGNVLDQDNHLDEAVVEFKEALRLKPDSAAAQKALDRVQQEISALH